MRKNNTLDDYEVGYGKPPKNTQFQKGISGNPRGRPKKSLNFDHELIKESLSLITVNDNGKRKRISKHQGITKQVINRALAGGNQALRTYFDLVQQAIDRITQSAPQQSRDSWKEDDLINLTDEQLMMLIHADVEKQKQECGKGDLSNAEFIKSRALQLRPSSTLENDCPKYK